MSLITQCPACSTLFKVVPDQLRVSQGWVRCGQCDEVFDANAHMRNLTAETEQQPESQPQAFAQPQPELDPDAQQNPVAEAESAPISDPLEEQPSEVPKSESPAPPAEYDWGSVLQSNPQHHEQSADVSVDAFLEKSPQELIDPPLPVPATKEFGLEAFSAEPAPDYLKSASFMAVKPAARSQSMGARIAWLTLLLLLVAGLAVQVVLHERDRLAATHPVLKPALLALCEVAACKVAPFKQIDAIVIDSSTFSRVQQDVYKLSVTLKNNAMLEVAKPALELTLTDTQDQAVLRRVIAPAELGDKVVSLAAGEDVSWTIPIAVKVPEGAARVAGYRVLAFYP